MWQRFITVTTFSSLGAQSATLEICARRINCQQSVQNTSLSKYSLRGPGLFRPRLKARLVT
jgi:hypothetical protein